MAQPPPKRRRFHGSPSQKKARCKHLRARGPAALPLGAEELDDAGRLHARNGDFQEVVPRQDTGLSILESALSDIASVSASISVGLDLSSVVPAATSIVGDVSSILDPSSAVPSAGDGSNSVPSSVASSSPPTPSTAEVPAGSSSVQSSTSNITISSTTSATTSSTSLPVLTTSMSRNSTLTTSSSRTNSSRSSSTRETGSTTTGFVATLSNGAISTFTRTDQGYVTTVDGQVYTVPAMETVTSYAYVPGAGTYTGGAAPSQTSASLSSSGSGGGSSPPAGTIAGGVVGGAAGLAVVVLIAMLALKWYRRNGETAHRALTAGSSTPLDADGYDGGEAPRGPGMAERAGMMPFAAAGLLRNQSQPAHTSSEPSERGFTRVSGRKLPSAFSGGMSSRSPPPTEPIPEHHEAERDSNASWYQSNYGQYDADGESPPTGDNHMRGDSPEQMTMSPGPQRTPQIHSGGPYTMSPPGTADPSSPQPNHPGFLGQSRFTEEIQ